MASEVCTTCPDRTEVAGQAGCEHRSTDRATGHSDATLLRRVGDYWILREVGRGGMGVVYEAEQVSLGRRVALKVIPRHRAGEQKALERFRREARAAARLHHTNIVPVFETGRDGDVVYYAMQFIDGQGLDTIIEQAAGARQREKSLARVAVSLDPSTSRLPYYRGVALIGHQAAAGLAFAHARGVLHRDIKPSNLLLDTAGVVWITDFGLAKSKDESLTRTGDILGTIRYMAPERFRGEGDARADVYALGLTLYELITLRPAFGSFDCPTLMELIKEVDPIRPRAIDEQVPRDLETVVLKAIDKDPNRRYPSADALAQDLRRFLDDEPVRARRTSALERVWRSCRRNAIVAGLVGTTLVLLMMLALGSTIAAIRINAERIRADTKASGELNARRIAEDAQASAEHAARQSQSRLVRLFINTGSSASGLGDYQSALLWYLRAWEADWPDPIRERNHRQRLAAAIARLPQLVGFCAHTAPVLDARFDSSSRRVLTRTSEAQAYLWDPLQGALTSTPLRHGSRVLHTEFSPDGKHIVTCSADRSARVWDASTGLPVGSPLEHPAVVHWATFSPVDQTVVTACGDGRVRFWDPPYAAARKATINCPSPVLCVVMNAKGNAVLTADANENAQVWDVTTAAPKSPSIPHRMVPGNPLDQLELPPAFSQDGNLVIAARDGLISLWDESKAVTNQRDLGYPINRVSLDSRGSRILAVGRGTNAYVLNAEAPGLPTIRQIPHPREVQQGAFHPDGVRIGTSSSSGVIHLWGAEGNTELIAPMLTFDSTAQLRFSPDGGFLLTASLDGTARVWQLDDRSFVPRLHKLDCGAVDEMSAIPLGPGLRAVFSPDARQVALIEDSGVARIVDEDGLDAPGVLLHLGEAVRFALFSRDGRCVLTAGRSSARVFAADTGKPVGPAIALARPFLAVGALEEATPPVVLHQLTVGLSRDGRRLAAIDSAKEIYVYDSESGAVLRGPIAPLSTADAAPAFVESAAAAPAVRRLLGCRLSGDGRWLAIAMDYGRGGVVRLLDVENGRWREFPSPHGFINSIDLSEDGTRLLVASSDTTLRTWYTLTGLPVGPPLRHRSFSRLAAFSADGRTVAAYVADGSLCVWDCESGDPIIPRFPAGVRSPRWLWFSRDGRRIVTQSAAGLCYKWDLPGLSLPQDQVVDFVHLLAASEIDATDGIARLNRSTLENRLERFRAAWLAWREASASNATQVSDSDSGARTWALPLLDSLRLQLQAIECIDRKEWSSAMVLLGRAIGRAPGDYRPLKIRSDLYARTRRFDKALTSAERALALDPHDDHSTWYSAAALVAFLGHGQRYDEICRSMERRFASSNDLVRVGATLRACLLRPKTAAQGDAMRRTLAAASEDKSGPGTFPGSAWATLALADYRADAPDRALVEIALARKSDGFNSNGALQALALSVEAASLHRLGQSEEARGALKRAARLLEPVFSEPGTGTSLGNNWSDWLSAKVIFGEVHALLGADSDWPANPFAP
jgi:WD40 repeat protein/tRNA A-37 threonylcarbamoyl transferase component Bud32